MTTFTYTNPTVGGSEDTWGTTLNANWTALGNFIGTLDSAELAVLDGITATTAELNLLDGVTLDIAAVTATAAELNHVDGVTSPIQPQINAKAPVNSPAFTGNPTAPTPATSDNDTTIATTAMVRSAIASYSVPSTAQVGSATAGLGAGAVGSYILAWDITWTGGTRGTGSTIAGTSLRPTGFSRVDEDYVSAANKVRVGYGSALGGTWRLMGYLGMLDGYGKYVYTGSMYLRIS
jgi:hypothetical protein